MTPTRLRVVLVTAGAVVALVVAALVVIRLQQNSQPTVCDGVSSDAGGCAFGQPTFTGDTCEEIGREYGTQLDRRGLQIIRGPTIQNGASRAAALNEFKVLAAVRANEYLRQRGLIEQCSADEFLPAAESQFSPEFRGDVGKFLHDGPEVSYEEWLADLELVLRSLIKTRTSPDKQDGHRSSGVASRNSSRFPKGSDA